MYHLHTVYIEIRIYDCNKIHIVNNNNDVLIEMSVQRVCKFQNWRLLVNQK